MVHFSSYIQAHRRQTWASHYVKWVQGLAHMASACRAGLALIHDPCFSPCSYSELKQLLYRTLEAPHAVYVPTKLSLSSGAGASAAAARAAAVAGGSGAFTARVTPGNMNLGLGVPGDTTAQEQFFRALEHEVARINDFALVRAGRG